MGLLDRARRRAERPVTDAVLNELSRLAPGIGAAGVTGLCPSGDEHYSILLPASGGGVLLVRCHPHWYIQRMSGEAVSQLQRTPESAAASLAYLNEWNPADFSRPLLAADSEPHQVAAFVSERLANIPAPRPTAAASPPAAASARGEADVVRRRLERVRELLQANCPAIATRFVSRPDASQYGLEASLDPRCWARAWASSAEWGYTVESTLGGRSWRRADTGDIGAPLDAVGTTLLRMLAIAGADVVHGGARGLQPHGYDGEDWAEFKTRYETCLSTLTMLAADVLPYEESDDEYTAREIAASALVPLFERRPDIQEAARTLFPR